MHYYSVANQDIITLYYINYAIISINDLSPQRVSRITKLYRYTHIYTLVFTTYRNVRTFIKLAPFEAIWGINNK